MLEHDELLRKIDAISTIDDVKKYLRDVLKHEIASIARCAKVDEVNSALTKMAEYMPETIFNGILSALKKGVSEKRE